MFENLRKALRSTGHPARREQAGAKAPSQPAKADRHRVEAQRMRRLAAITGASVCVALFAALYGVYTGISAQSALAATKAGTVATLCAKADIKAGVPFDASLVETKDIPEAFRAGAALGSDALSEEAALIGKPLLADLSAGEQVTSAHIAGTGNSSSLAAALEPGKEAVTMAVDAESGFAGQLQHNDLVRVVSLGQGAAQDTYIETICPFARVVSLDGRLEGRTEGYTSVTLEVAPAEADQIRATQLTSKISLVLASATAQEA